MLNKLAVFGNIGQGNVDMTCNVTSRKLFNKKFQRFLIIT